MAGIKRLEKTPDYINFLIQNLIKPENRRRLFDDSLGWDDLLSILRVPSTIIYGILERGLPKPIGAIFFFSVHPYRGCEFKTIVFKKEDEDEEGITELQIFPHVETALNEVIDDFKLKYVSTHIIEGDDDGAVLKGLAKKLGFEYKCLKEDSIFAGGKYRDVHDYYLLVQGKPKEKE